MAKFIVLNRFKDKNTKETYTEGQEIDITVKRAEEIAEALKDYDVEFLERVIKK